MHNDWRTLGGDIEDGLITENPRAEELVGTFLTDYVHHALHSPRQMSWLFQQAPDLAKFLGGPRHKALIRSQGTISGLVPLVMDFAAKQAQRHMLRGNFSTAHAADALRLLGVKNYALRKQAPKIRFPIAKVLWLIEHTERTNQYGLDEEWLSREDPFAVVLRAREALRSLGVSREEAEQLVVSKRSPYFAAMNELDAALLIDNAVLRERIGDAWQSGATDPNWRPVFRFEKLNVLGLPMEAFAHIPDFGMQTTDGRRIVEQLRRQLKAMAFPDNQLGAVKRSNVYGLGPCVTMPTEAARLLLNPDPIKAAAVRYPVTPFQFDPRVQVLEGNTLHPEFLAFMAYLAASTYHRKADLLPMHACWKLKTQFLSGNHGAQGTISYYNENGANLIIFSGRGSQESLDWGQNAQFWDAPPYPGIDFGGTTHAGFTAQAVELLPPIDAFIATHANAHTRIVTTGHSLGGALALLIANYLALKHHNVWQVLTFGQPKAAGENFYTSLTANFEKCGTCYVRCCNGADLVVRQPLWDVHADIGRLLYFDADDGQPWLSDSLGIERVFDRVGSGFRRVTDHNMTSGYIPVVLNLLTLGTRELQWGG